MDIDHVIDAFWGYLKPYNLSRLEEGRAEDWFIGHAKYFESPFFYWAEERET